jgi:AcrR family transcriptional regulator
MARTVNAEEQLTRRKAILDTAQRLVYTKGYEQMTIQDILDALEISKGAFYHYFDSKSAVLEAIIERMQEDVTQVLLPVIDDPDLTALEKLERYFATASQWKIERKAYLIQILRVWYADENAIVRQKVMSSSTRWITPMLGRIIRQGVEEGVFTTPYPDQAGQILLSLFTSFGDTFAGAILESRDGRQTAEFLCAVETGLKAHTEALERMLGAPPGSVRIMDTEMVKAWLEP